MKKSTKMTLMAGLLITPAIVAQAGEVRASGEETGVEQQAQTELEKLTALVQPLLPAEKENLTAEKIENYKAAVAKAVEAIKPSSMSSLAKNNRLAVSETENKTIYAIITEANKELSDLSKIVTNVDAFKTKAVNKTFTSATKYSTEAKSIETDVAALKPYLQLFLSNKQTVDYIVNAEKVVTLIAGLDAKVAYNTAEYRGKVEEATTKFNSLDANNEQPLVYNIKRLAEIETIIDEVKEMEDKVIDNAAISAVTSAVNKYNALTPTTKRNYILADKKATLDSWNTAVTTAATVEKQIQAISTEPFAKLGSNTATIKKTTVETFVKNTTKAYTDYNKIGPTEANKVDLKQLVPSGSRIIALNKVAKLANGALSFSTYSSSDAQQVEAVETEKFVYDVRRITIQNDVIIISERLFDDKMPKKEIYLFNSELL